MLPVEFSVPPKRSTFTTLSTSSVALAVDISCSISCSDLFFRRAPTFLELHLFQSPYTLGTPIAANKSTPDIDIDILGDLRTSIASDLYSIYSPTSTPSVRNFISRVEHGQKKQPTTSNCHPPCQHGTPASVSTGSITNIPTTLAHGRARLPSSAIDQSTTILPRNPAQATYSQVLEMDLPPLRRQLPPRGDSSLPQRRALLLRRPASSRIIHAQG